MITFMAEPYEDCIQEIALLIRDHWEEVATDKATVPLDVNFEYYAELARLGQLHIVCARSEGTLVGYHSTFVRPHIRYKSTLMGFVDVYFLHRDHRRGMTGLKLLRAAEASLKARGVKKICASTKLSLDMGVLYKRMGYQPAETLYMKYIGD
jgi:L-amino acid N-acyltransferase YncA